MSKKRTIEEIREYARHNSDSELLSEEYTDTYSPLRFRCSCGEEYTASWHQFYTQNKRICINCSIDRRLSKRRRSLDAVKDEIKKYDCEYVSGEYRNPKSKLVIRCSCGHNRIASLNTIRSKNFSRMCLECAFPLYHGVNKFTYDEVKRIATENGLVLLSTSYANAREKLMLKCQCGREFSTTLDSVIGKNKTRCDYCSRLVSSGERSISAWLKEHGIPFERQKGFDDFRGYSKRKYRFDFFLPAQRMCIEYDGQQHFKTVDFGGYGDATKDSINLIMNQIHDAVKNEYCKSHGLDIVRISYEEKDNIPEILNNKLIPR